MARPLITVFEATGAQGGSLVRALLARPDAAFRVRAALRDPATPAAQALAALGAELIATDPDDAASVQRAMRGAHGAFCVTDYWAHRSAQRDLEQATLMAEGAAREAVQHVVWSTHEDTRMFFPADGRRMPVLGGRFNVPHCDGKGAADHRFTARGLPVTLLRTAMFWDDLIDFDLWPQRDHHGRLELVLPTGSALVPGMAAADVGPCVAAIFRRGRPQVDRRIGLAGTHLSGTQMAQAFGRAFGETVHLRTVTPADYARRPVVAAAEWANRFQFLRDFNAAYCAARPVSETRWLHPGVLDFDTWLRAAALRHPVPSRLAA